MSNIPISSLPIALTIDGSEYSPIVQGGVTKRVQTSIIASLTEGSTGTQSANVVWAGPASGAAAGPTFRALVIADIPRGTDGQLIVGQTSAAPIYKTVSGDASLAASGAMTISTNAVSYAKFQQVAAVSLVGNATGSLANAGAITVGATLAFSGSALQTAALTGDVTASANSFVTTIAANAVSNAKFRQSAGLSVVGTTGSATANVADITGTANQFLGVNSAGTSLLFETMSGDATLASGVITLGSNVVSNAKFRQGVARSIVGVTGNATANVADIQGTANQVLVVNSAGTALAFGTVATAGLTANSVDNTIIRQGVARSVIGVTGNATSNVADIQGTANQVLVVNGAGTSLAFGTVATAGITANAVDNTIIRQGSARSVIGVTGNATANVADIQGTANQVLVVNSAGTALAFGAVNVASTAAVTGALGVANGGTALASYTTGDIIYASGSTTLASLADVATGQVLVSGGVGVAPSYSATPTVKTLTSTNATSASGNGGVSITTTQTSPNSSDTQDSSLFLSYTLTAASATNELVGRVIQFKFNNNLTGGGHIQNARMLEMEVTTQASTTVDALAGLYIVNGATAAGTVTTGYGIYIVSLQGTTKWGILDQSGGNWQSAGFIKSTSATAGLGYATGAGGAVTQATSKATGVTLSTVCGAITMNNAALAAATIVSFTLTNTAIAATDTLVLNHISGGTPGSYTLNARAAAGSATIDVRNNSAGSLSEAIVIQFAIVKAVNS